MQPRRHEATKTARRRIWKVFFVSSWPEIWLITQMPGFGETRLRWDFVLLTPCEPYASSPRSPLGPAVHEHGRRSGCALRDRRADCEREPCERRADSARHAQGAARTRGAA